MLQEIDIKSLFGLYSYHLEIKQIRFITGPNGYGKTTILRLIEYVYTQKYQELSEIPFEELHVKFDDGFSLAILQKRVFDEDPESDEHNLQNVILSICFEGEGIHENLIWESQSKHENTLLTNLSGYLLSHPVYFIKDDRLQLKSDHTAVMENARNLSAWLKAELEGRSIGKTNFRPRIDVFKQIIDNYHFANKSIEINTLHGYLFHVNSTQSPVLFGPGLKFLSSGEQHILIQTFDLLLNAPDDALVLIDEPELSNHLEWQSLFLDSLEKIVETRRLQCIICTHAPEIFKYKWDLSVDLFEQAENLSHIQ